MQKEVMSRNDCSLIFFDYIDFESSSSPHFLFGSKELNKDLVWPRKSHTCAIVVTGKLTPGLHRLLKNLLLSFKRKEVILFASRQDLSADDLEDYREFKLTVMEQLESGIEYICKRDCEFAFMYKNIMVSLKS